MPSDIRADHMKIVRDILGRYIPERQVAVFGSRAGSGEKRPARPTSDLDLCILGDDSVPLDLMGALRDAFSASDLPYRVDIVAWSGLTPEFRRVIEGGFEKL